MLWLVWTLFIGFVLALLALDLGVFHRKAHVVTVREALGWSALWVTLGLSFSVFIYFGYENHWFGLGMTPDAVEKSAEFPEGRPNDGRTAAVKYLTGYVVEESLSVDNIFVMAVLFGYFAVPAIYQHRVLFWGIIGAQVMRGAMIFLGATLIARFHWILYIFGVFLIVTAVKMLFSGEGEKDLHDNKTLKLIRRVFPITQRYHGQHFFVRAGSETSHQAAMPGEVAERDAVVEAAKKGTLMLTPLGVTLIMIETTDLVFAVDSIPAIFAITADPFLVFTSNIFAILGLRSMYFALAGAMNSLRYLKVALAVVLAVVGIKMLAAEWFKGLLGEHFNLYLLAAVLGILGTGVVASLVANKREARRGVVPRTGGGVGTGPLP
jgi:tellurite resistance protein TerC